MVRRTQSRQQRVPTGVPGLDVLLCGGLFRGGVYIVRGTPGAGKTIFGNQVAFANARRGGRSAYVTLLAEAHARMMLHLESLDFFDPDLVGGRVQYLSGFGALEGSGLRGVLDLLRRELKAKKVSILVVDGLIALNAAASSVTELKKFFHELQLHADLAGCTVLLLTGPVEGEVHPENTMVDGIFELRVAKPDLASARELVVHKFRGSDHLRGGHFVRITNAGLAIYPRIEALYSNPSREDRCLDAKVSSGVPQLDEMLNGGFPGGTTTMVLGPSGAGKTTLGLHYLNATPPKQKAIHFGFYETPARLLLKAKKLNLHLDRRVKNGELEILWQPTTETNVDELVNKLLDTVERTRASRLFIDGLDGLQRSTVQQERVHHIFTALANELRVRGVTTLYSFESPKFLGPEMEAPITGVSTLVENLIFLRFVEMKSELYRLLSIIKVRDTSYDPHLREFHICDDGIRLEKSFETAEAILSGTARVPETAQQADKTPPRTRKR